MAEVVLRSALTRAGRNAVVCSAGIAALVNEPAHDVAIAMASERSLDLTEHRAQQASVDLCRWAELVLVMEGHHREALTDIDPAVRGKTFLLGHWSRQEVPDPYKRSQRAWDQALALIDDGVAGWLKRL